MLNQRLNRIIGQLRGIQRMIDQKRDCNDILQQIAAVKKAIDSLSREVVVNDVCRYLAKIEDTVKIEKLVDSVMKI